MSNTDNMVALESLRDWRGQRLSGVATIRAARSLRLELDLLQGRRVCASVGVSESNPYHRAHMEGDSALPVFRAVFEGGHSVSLCENCARRALHTIARAQGAFRVTRG